MTLPLLPRELFAEEHRPADGVAIEPLLPLYVQSVFLYRQAGNSAPIQPARVEKKSFKGKKSIKEQVMTVDGIRRVYMGGLSADITGKDIVDRFSSFGAVCKVDIIRREEGECRGFAYVDLQCTEEAWTRCCSVYNGRVWKGGKKLKLEAAKEDYKVRLERERKSSGEKKKKTTKKRVRHAADMSIVTDESASSRKGWRRGRFGRALAVMHMRKPDGTEITIDPAHHTKALQKLFGSVRPKPVEELTLFYPSRDLESPASAESTDSDSSIPNVADDSIERSAEKMQSQTEIKLSGWAKVVSSGTSFRLGLLPEEPQVEVACTVDESVPSAEPGDALMKPAPKAMLPDYNFAALFGPIDLPFELLPAPNDAAEARAEWEQSIPILRSHYKERHKQAQKLQRRKTQLTRRRTKQ